MHPVSVGLLYSGHSYTGYLHLDGCVWTSSAIQVYLGQHTRDYGPLQFLLHANFAINSIG